MKTKCKTELMISIPMLCVLALIAAGCAAIRPAQDAATIKAPAAKTQIVEVYDYADVHYVCRFKNGEVLASTGDVSDQEKKSNVFMSYEELGEKSGPVAIAALKPDEPLAFQERPEGVSKEIQERLKRHVAGMKKGETKTVELTAQMISAPDELLGFARLSKVRTRLKEMKMHKEEFKILARKPAEIGQTYAHDPSFPGRVESVTDQDVVIRFVPISQVIQTPYGAGHVREEKDNYKIDIDARLGSLVRTGLLIGRISSVTDKMIVVDYRHPFGYEALICNMTVAGVTKAWDGNEETLKKAENPKTGAEKK